MQRKNPCGNVLFFLALPSRSQALKGRLRLGRPHEEQTSVRPVLLQLSTINPPSQFGVCPAWSDLLFQGICARGGGLTDQHRSPLTLAV